MLYGGASSKPSLDAVLKKINRLKTEIYGFISYKLITEYSKLNDKILEFIVLNGNKYVVSEAPTIYRLLIKHNRVDLVPNLNYLWEKYGKPTPIKCPKCGFNAVGPDQCCTICGYVVSENYIREQIGFNEKFQKYVSEASVAELIDLKNVGFILVSSDGVYHPRFSHKLLFENKVFYNITLKARDFMVIDEEISRRNLAV